MLKNITETKVLFQTSHYITFIFLHVILFLLPNLHLKHPHHVFKAHMTLFLGGKLHPPTTLVSVHTCYIKWTCYIDYGCYKQVHAC